MNKLNYKKEFSLEDHKIIVENGNIAKQSDQSFVIKWNDTTILTTMCFSKKPIKSNFLPLTLEFQENLFSVGKIPGSFFRREGRPSEFSILSARIVDRIVRSLFPKDFRHEVQIIINPFSIDYSIDVRVVSMFATSLILNISKLPFKKLIAGTMVGYVDGQFICNASDEMMEKSTLKLFLAGTKNKINMIEIEANELSEKKMMEAIKIGHQSIQKLISIQEEILASFDFDDQKQEFQKKENLFFLEFKKVIENHFSSELNNLILIVDKKERQKKWQQISEEIILFAKENYFHKFIKNIKFLKNDEKEISKNFLLQREYEEQYQIFINNINEIFEKCVKEKVRNYTLKNKKRIDQRNFDQLRKLSCEIDYLSNAHGSAIFSRGETQTMTVLTLGSLLDQKIIDDITKNKNTTFMHHYRAQPFSMGITQRSRGVSRREIGHGKLGEKTIKNLLPNNENFPYTIRLMTEVLGSDGSTSQAAICSSSLALMCGGVPIKKPLAGIGIGLIKDQNEYHLLNDIQAWEDFYGDMDFKVSGTKDGICGAQLDLKIDGLPFEIIEKILEMAKKSRLKVLEFMNKKISESRKNLHKNAMKFSKFFIEQKNIGQLIGPGGKNIKKIISDHPGLEIDINNDGKVILHHLDGNILEKIKEICLCNKKNEISLKVGDIFKATVIKEMNYGFFISLDDHQDISGLIHVSQLKNRKLKVYDKIEVQYLGINEKKKTDFKLI